MLTHWSQFVPNNYVNPTSEDIKLYIIIIKRGNGDDGGSEEWHRKEEMGMFGDTGNGCKFSFRAMMSK